MNTKRNQKRNGPEKEEKNLSFFSFVNAIEISVQRAWWDFIKPMSGFLQQNAGGCTFMLSCFVPFWIMCRLKKKKENEVEATPCQVACSGLSSLLCLILLRTLWSKAVVSFSQMSKLRTSVLKSTCSTNVHDWNLVPLFRGAWFFTVPAASWKVNANWPDLNQAKHYNYA